MKNILNFPSGGNIETLEGALEAAKKQKVRAVAVVIVFEDGDVGTVSHGESPFSLIGGLQKCIIDQYRTLEEE